MEKLMQYVWQHRLWLPSDMATVDGQRVDVLDPGLLNTDAGPDFFNAKIRIGERVWAGNVEVHVRASDWHRHGHDSDPAYDTVVLHVVEHDDTRIRRKDGAEIPQIVMPCAADFSERYHEMVDNPVAELPCAAHLLTLPRIYLGDWISALAFERLYQKSERVLDWLERFKGDWQQTIYATLARALGFGINSDPFERLAAATPLRCLMRHRGDAGMVEAMLFGQSGLLDKAIAQYPEDPYVSALKRDYDFARAKYGLEPLRDPGWKMARMRPQNFPHRRIATLAALVSGGFEVSYSLPGVRNADDARSLFDFPLTGYWARRYSFGPPAASRINTLSRSSTDSLIINVVAPVLHAYGCRTGHEELTQRAVDLLQSVPAENNSIVRLFTAAGVQCDDAFTSQALVQLRRNYCQPRKCLYCRIGHRFLAQKAIRRK